MKGSIQTIQRDKGTVYRASIDLPRGPDGKRRRKTQSFEDEDDAEAWLVRLNHQLNTGQVTCPADMTLAQLLEDWNDRTGDSLKAATVEKRTWAIENHIVPSVGHLKLEEVNPYHLQTLYDGLKDDLSPRSIKAIHDVLHAAIEWATDMEIVPSNPTEKVSPPRASDPDWTVLNDQQIQDYLEAARGRRYYPALFTIVMTGLRRGEALGLRWEYVDLEAGKLRIRKTLSRREGDLVLGDVKTDSSRRSVALMDSNVTVLKAWRQQQLEERMAHEAWGGAATVFTTQEGHRVSPSSLRRTNNRIVEVADVPEVTIHDLRHTHATQMLKNGTHPKVVQERLGHSRIEVTMDTYSHVLPGMQEDAVEALEQSIGADTV